MVISDRTTTIVGLFDVIFLFFSHSHDPFGRAKWPRSKFKQCKGKASCKIRVPHPPNGNGI